VVHFEVTGEMVSLAPSLIHYFRRVPEILEPFRYAWGLMPADLIFLRELGAMSRWIPVILLGELVLAVRLPTARPSLIALGACLSAGFSALYASYCLLIITTYLPSYTNAMEGRTDLLQACYARHSKAEQPGAGQPATKPADKVPAKAQPSNPTSKDGPR
jgi:hypothetical protein